jgi:phage-related protein
MVENFGECLIVFSCKPLKKEIFGDGKIILTQSGTLYNEGLASNPYIKVVGSGDIAININNQKLILKGVEDYVEVDTELYNCFKGNVNQNNKMYSDFPVLEEGKNEISFTGNVSQLEILPRWVVL